ncbi:MAG: hypothetical protein IT319_06330 [Anaerolineae bacterium]|nr:hypothetical protein [Anaerolineae bacterium]
MTVDRSMRNALAAILLVAALFVAMNQIVASAPFADWWLPILLFVVGAALVFAPSFGRAPSSEDAAASPENTVQTYLVAPSAPQLPITTGSVEEAEAAAVLPFGESTTPDVPTTVVERGPSQDIPTDRTPDTGSPAPELKYTARTEHANPETSVAATEAPAVPPDKSDTTPARTEPEKDVVAEKTAAPQQPYEAERVGAITPEQVERVMDEQTDNAHDRDVPVVTESASPAVTAVERDGEGTVGSADDLTKINGIGAKSAAALKAAGIDSFHKLANSSEDALRAAINSAGVRLVGDVTTWAQQASYAARGDWQGLSRYNAERRAANA